MKRLFNLCMGYTVRWDQMRMSFGVNGAAACRQNVQDSFKSRNAALPILCTEKPWIRRKRMQTSINQIYRVHSHHLPFISYLNMSHIVTMINKLGHCVLKCRTLSSVNATISLTSSLGWRWIACTAIKYSPYSERSFNENIALGAPTWSPVTAPNWGRIPQPVRM